MTAALTFPSLDFELPPALEAGEPPEARGLARDDVRLMVSRYGNDYLEHARFRELPRFLAPGDLLVVNTSGTLNAALPAERADDRRAAEAMAALDYSDDTHWGLGPGAPAVDESAARLDTGKSAHGLWPEIKKD